MRNTQPATQPPLSHQIIYSLSTLPLLRQLEVDGRSPLLALDHDLEAVEVAEARTQCSTLALLRPGRRFPLLGNLGLVETLRDDTRTCTAREFGELIGCEGKVTVGESLTRDVSFGTIDECLWMR